jgi:hypothetical protein
MSNAAFVLETDVQHSYKEFVSLGPKFLTGKGDVRAALATSSPDALWIVLSSEAVPWLAEAVVRAGRAKGGHLLFLTESRAASMGLFLDRFTRVARCPDTVLPYSELATVLSRRDKADFCIGGSIFPDSGIVQLLRGDLTQISVLLSDFPTTGRGLSPDRSRFEVTDHGHTLKFGDYEAPFDTLLYERDQKYRQRTKQLRLAADNSLGGALRRLRLQRRMRLTDMVGLEKAVARIERGEVRKPRRATLARIARLLDVVPEDIRDY